MFPRKLWLSAFIAVAGLESNAAPPPGYYASAQDKTGAVLRLALHDIIKGHTVIPYSSSTTNDTVDALNELDADPLNTNNVILIYARRSDPKTNFNVSGGWNREHLWPNSYGIDEDMPAYSDLHNLRPEDVNVNSARGNKFYDLSDTNDPVYRKPGFVEAPLTSTDSDSWEPPDMVKGDIARAMFYMDVRYEGTEGNELDFILTDNTASITVTTNLMGKLSTLLRWHWADRVDAAEQRRNDLVFELFQHNRNPFVDHPLWVDSVYMTNRPSLSVERIGHLVRISWPTNLANGALEWTPLFPASWTGVSAAPQQQGSVYFVELAGTNGTGIYRLRVP